MNLRVKKRLYNGEEEIHLIRGKGLSNKGMIFLWEIGKMQKGKMREESFS